MESIPRIRHMAHKEGSEIQRNFVPEARRDDRIVLPIVKALVQLREAGEVVGELNPGR